MQINLEFMPLTDEDAKEINGGFIILKEIFSKLFCALSKRKFMLCKQRLFVFNLKIIKFMKKLELQNFGVVEMNAKQLGEVEGGIIPIILAA